MSIVITGAAGQLGRKVVEELKRRVDATSIVALSRDPGKIADLGVPTRYADFDDPGSLAAAFAGAERLLLISTDKVGARLAQHINAVNAAAAAGVGHVFYTSAPRASDDGNPALVIPEHRGTEEALAASGVPYTALRNNIYTETLLLAVPQIVASGVHAANSGAGGTSYVTRDDLAAATAAILADPADPGRVLELTGPAPITAADLAAIVRDISGKEIRVQALSDEQLSASLAAAGLAPEAIAALVSFGRAAREGYLGIVTDVVERYLGRTPTTVAAFLAATTAAVAA
ncbi:MAG TPA: NAD(P)H-binding protein [Chloroflexota bacterium]|nr:NAD(P)H-binding protein [Chloroflexota bacterium]